MLDLANLYCRKLDLPDAVFTHIDHEDAMVAAVFKISQSERPDLILKVCFTGSNACGQEGSDLMSKKHFNLLVRGRN